ncbi:MAG: aromatic amino acid lyase, partial [Caldilinea sp.]|nr:aromatic amino acid lyase [Caldilinea sp.]
MRHASRVTARISRITHHELRITHHALRITHYQPRSISVDTVLLDGTQLSIEQVMAVAYGEPGAPEVRLTEAAAAHVTRAAQAVQQLIDEGVVAYGITTGFGAFKDRIIPAGDVATLQRNIVMS